MSRSRPSSGPPTCGSCGGAPSRCTPLGGSQTIPTRRTSSASSSPAIAASTTRATRAREVDALLEEAAVLQDTEARYRLYHQAEQIIVDDAPIIPTFWSIDHYLVRDCVENWPDVGTIVPKYRYIEIDTTKE